MGPHPVDVALDRVDLTVMRQHPERLRQPPLREGVGRIALVIDREGRFKTLVHQIGVESRNLLGEHHALVDDRAARERAQVEPVDLRGDCGFFDPATDDVEFALELLIVDVLLVADQDLFDLGAGGVGLLAQNFGVHRNMAPAVNIMAHAENFRLHDGPAALLRAKIGARQEDLADSDHLAHIGLMPSAADLIVEEGGRNLHMDARAVAGFAIGVHRTAVPDRFERVDPVLHDLARGLPVQRDHEANAAGRFLVIRFIEGVLVHPFALGLFGGNPVCVEFSHVSASSEKGSAEPA